MDRFELWFILGVLLLFGIVGIAVIRSGRTRASGEICLRAGVWKCTVCGDLVPVRRGAGFPRCCSDPRGRRGRWRFVAEQEGVEDA